MGLDAYESVPQTKLRDDALAQFVRPKSVYLQYVRVCVCVRLGGIRARRTPLSGGERAARFVIGQCPVT